MKTKGKILFLTYFFSPKDYGGGQYKYVRRRCGIYLPFDIYLYSPLKKIFTKVIKYDYFQRRGQIGARAMNKEVLALVRREKPKYVLWTSFYHDIFPETFEAIRAEGTKIIGWFFDDEWRFEPYSKWLAPHLDCVVTNTITAVPKYERLAVPAIASIQNPGIQIDKKWTNIKKRYDVSFVGSRRYGDREQFIAELEKHHVNVRLFGHGWDGYVPFRKMIQIIQTSKINLNFSRTIDSGSLQIKGRIFQTCLAGGFLLTEYVPGIQKYFLINKEIACFKNKTEMIKKIHYYLLHDKERNFLALNGWKRAVKSYTSEAMVAKAFSEIEKIDFAFWQKKRRSKKNTPLREFIESVARYHLDWGKGFLEANYRNLWQESFFLSLKANPKKYLTWQYLVLGIFPSTARLGLIKANLAYLAVLRVTGKLIFLPYYFYRALRKRSRWGVISSPEPF